MALAPSIIGITFAAFCLWLSVRIVNRRERWAKWTAAVVVLTVVVLYPLSLPWATSYLTLRDPSRKWRVHLVPIYAPLIQLIGSCPDAAQYRYVAYCSWVDEISGASDHLRRWMNKT